MIDLSWTCGRTSQSELAEPYIPVPFLHTHQPPINVSLILTSENPYPRNPRLTLHGLNHGSITVTAGCWALDTLMHFEQGLCKTSWALLGPSGMLFSSFLCYTNLLLLATPKINSHYGSNVQRACQWSHYPVVMRQAEHGKGLGARLCLM